MKVFKYVVAFGFLAYSLVCTHDTHAADITVYPKFLPERFMLVDKKKQECFLYNRLGAEKYICSTGQVSGDKQYEGDKKTPEESTLLHPPFLLLTMMNMGQRPFH